MTSDSTMWSWMERMNWKDIWYVIAWDYQKLPGVPWSIDFGTSFWPWKGKGGTGRKMLVKLGSFVWAWECISSWGEFHWIWWWIWFLGQARVQSCHLGSSVWPMKPVLSWLRENSPEYDNNRKGTSLHTLGFELNFWYAPQEMQRKIKALLNCFRILDSATLNVNIYWYHAIGGCRICLISLNLTITIWNGHFIFIIHLRRLSYKDAQRPG